MRIGTKILLLMLLITVGSAAIVTWIVTLNVTTYERQRANDQISVAIARYVRHLDDQRVQVSRVVRALLEAPAQRSLLQAAGDPTDTASREQLRLEVLGRDVQAELQSREGSPAFHVVVNLAGEVLVVSSPDPRLEAGLAGAAIRWPTEPLLTARPRPVMQYLATPAGLFLAMGVPLRTQLDQAPDVAYFVGFRINDEWVRQQLLAERSAVAAAAGPSSPPLVAWFVVDGSVVARASSDPVDRSIEAFTAQTPVNRSDASAAPATDPATAVEHVQFETAGEQFVGQSSALDPQEPKMGRLVLASSLDRALLPLHRLQREILFTAGVACLVAVIACRFIARMIARPIQELVKGTHRIATGQFDQPVQVRRHDELGTLADSFNEMAAGLRERDDLRDQRTKIERDLAVARKIQMDVLPKELPPCPGYDMAAYSLPAEQTGGDIYDLVALALDQPAGNQPSDGAPALVMLLADATGHGIGPALSVTQVRAMLRIGVRLRAGLDDVFAQINRQLCQDLGADRFVTAFLGLLDPSGHSIDYHSAGQGPLLHFRAKNHQFDWLDTSMPPLGVDEDPISDGVRRIHMQPGDLLVLLTDGFYEYHNPQREQFGQQRVADVILRHHHLTPRQLLHELLEATQAFAGGAPQMDDMTAVIIRRLPE
jgi:serine phosphatase RsbU (regulator of sigma subunit)